MNFRKRAATVLAQTFIELNDKFAKNQYHAYNEETRALMMRYQSARERFKLAHHA